VREGFQNAIPWTCAGVRGLGVMRRKVSDVVARRDPNISWSDEVSGLYDYLAEVLEGWAPGLGGK